MALVNHPGYGDHLHLAILKQIDRQDLEAEGGVVALHGARGCGCDALHNRFWTLRIRPAQHLAISAHDNRGNAAGDVLISKDAKHLVFGWAGSLLLLGLFSAPTALVGLAIFARDVNKVVDRGRVVNILTLLVPAAA